MAVQMAFNKITGKISMTIPSTHHHFSIARHNEEGHDKARHDRHIAQYLKRQCIQPRTEAHKVTTAQPAARPKRHTPPLAIILELLLLLLIVEIADILCDAIIVRGLHQQIVQLDDKEQRDRVEHHIQTVIRKENHQKTAIHRNNTRYHIHTETDPQPLRVDPL